MPRSDYEEECGPILKVFTATLGSRSLAMEVSGIEIGIDAHQDF